MAYVAASNGTIDRALAGRKFQVYSISSGESVTKPMSFSRTFNELERIGNANGACNGLDVREVK